MILENLADNGYDVKKIFLGICCFIVLIFFIIFIINRMSNEDYVIVSESLILKKKNGKWSQVTEIDNKILEKKYTVIGEFGSKSDVTINYNKDSNEFYYIDRDYKDLMISRPSAVYSSNIKKISALNYETEFYDSSDDVFIKKATDGRSISDFADSLFKYVGDLDGDGKNEIIYTISNKKLNGFSGNYSTIFLVSDGKYIGKFTEDTSKPYMVRGILDLDGDGNYEIVVSEGDIDISTFDSKYKIYSYKNKKVTVLLD